MRRRARKSSAAARTGAGRCRPRASTAHRGSNGVAESVRLTRSYHRIIAKDTKDRKDTKEKSCPAHPLKHHVPVRWMTSFEDLASRWHLSVGHAREITILCVLRH